MAPITVLGAVLILWGSGGIDPAVGAGPKRVAESVIAQTAQELSSADTSAARAAAARLADVRNPSATAALTDALALGLSPSVALAALAALEKRADPRALPTLEYYLKVRSKALRAAAARAAAAQSSSKGDALVIAALGDPTREVRGVAAELVGSRQLRSASPTLVAMLKRGEKEAGPALVAIADASIARAVAETLGETPDELLAQTLGQMLLSAKFGPDTLRVEVVRALGKIPGSSGASALATYVAETPEKPPRASRREAEKLMGEKL